MLLWWSGLAWARCVVQISPPVEVEGRLRVELRAEVGAGRPDCSLLRLPWPEAAVAEGRLEGRIRRWDDTKIELGAERFGVDPQGPATLVGLPELVEGDRVELELRYLPGQRPVRRPLTGALTEARTELRLLPAPPDRRGGAPPGLTSTLERRRYSGDGGTLIVPFPRGAEGAWCERGPQGQAQPGLMVGPSCWLDLPQGESELRWGWSRPELELVGERAVAGPLALGGHCLVVQGDGVEVELSGGAPGPEGSRCSGAEAPLRAGELPPQALSWRVTRLGELSILPDRAALVAMLEERARLVSLPEPALPTIYKRRPLDEQLLPDLLEELRQRVKPGSLPGLLTLHLRGLHRARWSGWGSEWEMALIFTRYLQQLRLPAAAMLLRPADSGPAELLSPLAWERAVVWTRYNGQELWLDPACRACAPGELRPELWGAAALGRGPERVPPAPSAPSRHWGRDAQGRPVERLSGAEALRLRLELLELPAEERAGALERRGGARLVAHEGLAEQGQPIRLTWASGSGPLLDLPTLPEGQRELVHMERWGQRALPAPPGLVLPELALPPGYGLALAEGELRLEWPGPVLQRSELARFLEVAGAAGL